MSTKFEKYGQSFGYAAAGLTSAAVGLSLSALASMNPMAAATISPVLVALTFEVSKKLMTVAYSHLNEAIKIKNEDLKIQEVENHFRPSQTNTKLIR